MVSSKAGLSKYVFVAIERYRYVRVCFVLFVFVYICVWWVYVSAFVRTYVCVRVFPSYERARLRV